MERWLRNRVPSTQRHYLGYMARFELLTGLTPDRFLEWCKTVESVEVQDLIDRTCMEFKPAIQFCYRVALRSFLSHNRYNMPKVDLQYVSQAWHRGYKREEIQALLGQLRQKHHKLFVVMAAETGLRSHVLMQLRYCHIMEDIEAGTIPVAIRLEPRFYAGKKAAGCTFLGEDSTSIISKCLRDHRFEARPESRLIPSSYYSIWAAIHRAKMKVGLDSRIQSCHGFRKYFENALDNARIDHEKKMLIEGHFAGTRSKYYTDRDVEQLRDLYRTAYPFVKLNIGRIIQSQYDDRSYEQRLTNVESQIAGQKILESRLTILEQELNQMKQTRG